MKNNTYETGLGTQENISIDKYSGIIGKKLKKYFDHKTAMDEPCRKSQAVIPQRNLWNQIRVTYSVHIEPGSGCP